jgi:hypothetical protein
MKQLWIPRCFPSYHPRAPASIHPPCVRCWARQDYQRVERMPETEPHQPLVPRRERGRRSCPSGDRRGDLLFRESKQPRHVVWTEMCARFCSNYMSAYARDSYMCLPRDKRRCCQGIRVEPCLSWSSGRRLWGVRSRCRRRRKCRRRGRRGKKYLAPGLEDGCRRCESRRSGSSRFPVDAARREIRLIAASD